MSLRSSRFNYANAVVRGGLLAGVLALAAIFAVEAANGQAPISVLQEIATSRLGAPAVDGGIPAGLIGLALHFSVSFVLASSYVVASTRFPAFKSRWVACGSMFGLITFAVMMLAIVPLSRATFGDSWTRPMTPLVATLFIHIFLLGLPIAWAASRIETDKKSADMPQTKLSYGPWVAILLGTAAAGVLDIAAVINFWVGKGATPLGIFQSIASSVLGERAFEGGLTAAGLGVFLHFAVSFVFTAVYVAVSLKVVILRVHPIIFGLVYGLIVHWIMSTAIVPLSLAEFNVRPPTPESYTWTLIIHTVLFGLPIALSASRIRRPIDLAMSSTD